ncbi:MAG: trimeric intracellular cation channel family protein [Chloroflexota bacterium]
MHNTVELTHIYTLPIWFDYVATLLWATSGALFAARRGYDITGITFFSILACTGGGVIRDGIFLNNGPAAILTSPMYIVVPLIVSGIIWIAGARISAIAGDPTLNTLIDAIGTGGFALYGLQLALLAKVSVPGALLVGVMNGIGGGLLRDVVANRVPQVVQPGGFYALAALGCCLTFYALVQFLRIDATPAAMIAMAVMVAIRVGALHFNLQTAAVPWFDPQSAVESRT